MFVFMSSPLPKNADILLKVIRRLEMHHLEQQCWRYLISIIDSFNCESLHRLADKYDCPPLKLSAWRLLQQSNTHYVSAPDLSLADRSLQGYVSVGTGFTGPGEAPYIEGAEEEKGWHSEEEEEEEEEEGGARGAGAGEDGGSFFNVAMSVATDPERARGGSGEDFGERGQGGEGEGEGEMPGSEFDSSSRRGGVGGGGRGGVGVAVIHPSLLPASTSAAELVKAWAARLQVVYNQCMPQPLEVDVDADAPHVLLSSSSSFSPSASLSMGRGRGRGSGGRSAGKDKRREKDRDNKASYDWTGELVRFYTAIKMPEKIPEIATILDTWEGKEDQMVGTLLTKYKKLIPSDLYQHLDHLHNLHETQTVSSFVK